MGKYQKSDDGKVVDGAIVVWIGPRPPVAADSALARAAASRAQTAALAAAAKAGVPVCQRCEPPAPARGGNGGK